MSLFQRHHHVWVDVGNSEYHPPINGKVSFGSLEGDRYTVQAELDRRYRELLRYTSGWTTFHQRCADCGEVVSREVLGRYAPAAIVEAPR